MGLPHPAEVCAGSETVAEVRICLEDRRGTIGVKIGKVFPVESSTCVKSCGLSKHLGLVGCGVQGLGVEAQGWRGPQGSVIKPRPVLSWNN